MLRLSVVFIFFLTGCGLARFDLYHPLLRSDYIQSLEFEKQLLRKASISTTEDGRVRVLSVSGTPYERGYQHGALLREEVRDNLEYLYDKALDVYYGEMIFEEAFERLRPNIPEQYMQEMAGLAHGARLPLKVVHYIHALPSLTEWGGKKKLKKIAKEMMFGDLGTSCSNIAIDPQQTIDQTFYAVRVLDWGLHRISKLHEYPLVIVSKPDTGVRSANLTWAGFIGAVSGMNEQGITLGEMGYGDPDGETLRGKPMIFLLREILEQAHDLEDVRNLISQSAPTNSFAYVMADGKTREAELYIRDPNRFLVYQPGTELDDQGEILPAIPGISYGGHYEDRLAQFLIENQGRLSLQVLQENAIPEIAMKSNFQNVIYAPERLEMWFNYSPGPGARAAEQPYSHLSLAKAIEAQDRHLAQVSLAD